MDFSFLAFVYGLGCFMHFNFCRLVLEEGANVRSGGAFFQNSVDAASKVLESF